MVVCTHWMLSSLSYRAVNERSAVCHELHVDVCSRPIIIVDFLEKKLDSQIQRSFFPVNHQTSI